MKYTSLKMIAPILQTLQKGDWLVVDVDDTLITPQAMMFRTKSPHHTFLDKIKEQPKVDEIIATWRLNRKIMLVEPTWPETIESLKNRGIIVIALTQMHTGTFASIPSVEQWRFNELCSFGITFSPYATHQVETLIDNSMPATLYQGILFTGSHSKADTLKSFITKYHKPSRLVFIDDRLEHVESLHTFCASTGIIYTGCHYQAADTLPYDPSQDFGDIQSHTLEAENTWIEDTCILQEQRVNHG